MKTALECGFAGWPGPLRVPAFRIPKPFLIEFITASMVAAIYTRQTYVLAAPLTAFIWLLVQHGPRKALALVAMVGGGSLGLLAVLNWLTGGGFLLNTVIANMNEFR